MLPWDYRLAQTLTKTQAIPAPSGAGNSVDNDHLKESDCVDLFAGAEGVAEKPPTPPPSTSPVTVTSSSTPQPQSPPLPETEAALPPPAPQHKCLFGLTLPRSLSGADQEAGSRLTLFRPTIVAEDKGKALETVDELGSSGPRPTLTEGGTLVSTPHSPKHTVHVVFNTTLSRFEGLDGMPEAWQGMNKQFGVPIQDVPKMHVDGYEQKIPAVLAMLKKLLIERGGLSTVGIFRLAPDKDECDHVKKMINQGTFDGTCDVHVAANLIKVWFRECPNQLYDGIPEAFMAKIGSLTNLVEIISEMAKLPETNRALIHWLLDLMSLVVMQEGINRMSARNMAIVMSPNLFRVKSENPMVVLTQAQQVADFTLKMLIGRLRDVHGYEAGLV